MPNQCMNNHDLVPDNVRIDSRGYKRCRACERDSRLRKRLRRENTDGRTGRNCTHGHIDPPRTISSGNCKLCMAERETSPNAQSMRRKSANIRREVIGHYSGGKYCCAECGTTEYDILQIDHLSESDGRKHRRKLNPEHPTRASGIATYRDLRRRGYPAGYQVLCSPCNWTKYRNSPQYILDREAQHKSQEIDLLEIPHA